MTHIEPRLALLTFPQRYDGTTLHLRFLVVPRLGAGWSGNPLAPLLAGFPNPADTTAAFADANLQFEARIISGLDAFPTSGATSTPFALPEASGVVATSRPLFESLVAPLPGRFDVSPAPPRLAPAPAPRYGISKYLPVSYRTSFVFTGPTAPGALIDDSYHCAMRDRTTPNPLFQQSPDTVSWGQVYAFCLRQPRLAMRLGLVREASFAIDDALLVDGGYVYVSLADDSAYAAQVGAQFTFISHYAARIPTLAPGVPRQLFAAVQFPVLFDDPAVPGPPAAAGAWDRIFVEAAEYDDGFAKIVHGTQPVSQNLLVEEADEQPPVHDIGIRIGWDDEQMLTWQNRQMVPDATIPPVAGVAQRIDAPMGVFGYRIDARANDAEPWRSLVRVRPRAPVMLDDTRIDAADDTVPGMELAVEVHPMQLDGNQATGRFWLPAYMSQWNGHSLVLPDEDAAALYHTEAAGSPLGRQYEAMGLDDIPLRYGNSYQLRVRLMDPTGGGPAVSDSLIHESPAPIATVPFRRHVVPEPVRLANLPSFPRPLPAGPEEPDNPRFTDDSLRIARPLLGYPSVVFTGKYADPVPRLQAASNRSIDPDPANRERAAFGIPDPDVQHLVFDVEVRALKMDNALSLSRKEGWALLYSTTRTLPADFDAEREIPLTFRDANVLRFGDPTDLGDFELTRAEIDALADELPLPTARDVRITVRAAAPTDDAYWARGAHVGKPTQLVVRRDATQERGLIADDSDGRRIRALWLRPDSVREVKNPKALTPVLFARLAIDETPSVVERLAQSLDLAHKGMTLVGKRGERVAFACSRRIRHTLAPDASSLTLAAREDLVNHWVVGMTLRLDRDWTWEGLRHIGFDIFRDGTANPDGRTQVGEWEIIQTASQQALHDAKRTYTRLVFLDAVDPQFTTPAPKQHFPALVDVNYTVEPRFRREPVGGVDALAPLSLRLPVTTPPAQVPKIVAAGLALSKYERSADYATTEPRRRTLWLEFDRPPDDPNDAYFIRMLGYAADPLLSDHRVETLVPPEEPSLGIDAEMVRSISPGQSDDNAGLSAMIPLTPGNTGVHYSIPVPPGMTPEGAEMFGLFTYELRTGHMGIWSTAQARFGRPLRTTGVQHPAPTLLCTADRDTKLIIVEAPYAQAVLNGKNVTASPPRTQIWALLYAQVRQADDKDTRNILLDDRQLRPRRPTRERARVGSMPMVVGAFENIDAQAHGLATWTMPEVLAMLASLGLPGESPLSVLCVEMMPTMAALLDPMTKRGGSSLYDSNLAALAFAEIGGNGAATNTAMAEPPTGPRPLTDGLGHFRILRTSPLAAIPDICCTDC